jgi:hypothetical protein
MVLDTGSIHFVLQTRKLCDAILKHQEQSQHFVILKMEKYKLICFQIKLNKNKKNPCS